MVPDAIAKPADAAANAIDAVRAVADVSVHAVVDAGPTPSSTMNVLKNYCVAVFREPRPAP